MRHPLALVAAAALFLLAQAAAAQETFTSVAGPWWFSLGGKDQGSIVLQFSEPSGGTFTVVDVTLTGHESFGFSHSLADFFTITAGESLGFDSDRNVVGDLNLTLQGGGTAVLSIVKGKPDKTFSTMSLKGTIDGVKVKLKGSRPPAAFPVLTGETNQGNLTGKGVKSKAMDLRVETSTELGPPAYDWFADGPAKIDGAEDSASLSGTVMLTPSFKAFGMLASDSDFGSGLSNGKLRLPDPNSPIPKFGLKAETTVPKVTVKGQLTQAIEPVLLVTPQTFDFGAVRLDDPNATKVFTVANVGVDQLSGSVTRLNGSSTDFEVIGDDSYGPLDPNSTPAQIEIGFSPTSNGAKSAQFRFSVDGGAGSVVVSVNGTGGVAAIETDPADTLLFGTVAVGSTFDQTIKVTNTGDSTLTGAATLGVSTPLTSFQLVGVGGTTPTSISYTLAPGASQTITVRFKPTVTTQATGSVNFTGGGGATVSLSGNAP